jgi:hypothetical protein
VSLVFLSESPNKTARASVEAMREPPGEQQARGRKRTVRERTLRRRPFDSASSKVKNILRRLSPDESAFAVGANWPRVGPL